MVLPEQRQFVPLAPQGSGRSSAKRAVMGGQLAIIPCALGQRPVSILTRAGEQIGIVV
jgi:hypothetical protein